MIQRMSNSREYKYEWDILYLKCTKCWTWKTIEWFFKKSWRPFGVRTECKECEKKYVQKNRDRVSENQKSWRENHKEWILEYKDKYRKSNKDKMKEYRKEYYELNKESILNDSRDYKSNRSKELWFNWVEFHEKARRYSIRHWLKPSECPICWSNDRIDIHHPSYDSFDKWSSVVFCCRSCHQRIHSWIIECPKPINLLS